MTPAQIVQNIWESTGGDAYGYVDNALAVLQAKVAFETGEQTRKLVKATWALATVTIVLAGAALITVVIQIAN